MRHISTILLSLALLTPTLALPQQDKAEEVKDKAANKAENRLDTRVDQGLEKGLNALEGMFSKKKKKKKKAEASVDTETKKERQTPTSLENLIKEEPSSELAELEFEEMDFVGSYVLTINSSKKGKEQGTMVLEYYFNKNKWAMVTHAEGAYARFIMDFEAKLTTMLSDNGKGQKSGFIMPMQNRLTEAMLEDSDPDTENSEFKRTGNTKMIEGKLCHEYIGQNDDGKYESWIDESAEMDMAKQWGAFSKKKGSEKGWQNVPSKGIMMETNWTSKDGKETVHIITSKVVIGSVEMSIFETDGYEVMDMRSMPGLGGQ